MYLRYLYHLYVKWNQIYVVIFTPLGKPTVSDDVKLSRSNFNPFSV